MPPMENNRPLNSADELTALHKYTVDDTIVKIDSIYSEFKRVFLAGFHDIIENDAKHLNQIHLRKCGDTGEGEDSKRLADVVNNLHSECKDLHRRLIAMTSERDQSRADCKKIGDDVKVLLDIKERQLQDQYDEIETLKGRGHMGAMTPNEFKSLTQDNAKLRQKLETSEKQGKIHRQQAAKFREMIQKKSVGPEVNDAMITAQYGKLVGQIQRIIRTSYTFVVAPPMPKETDSALMKDLYSCFQQGLTPSESQNRVRGLVFYCLNNWIILKASFGLADMDEKAVIENGLTQFEGMINQNSTVPTTEIAEWRTMTLKLAQILRPIDSPQTHCRWVAGEILYLLAPLERLKHETPAENQAERVKLQSQWEQLCIDACGLTMMLRSHKDAYSCEFPKKGEVLRSEDAEAQVAERINDGAKKAESEELVIVYALSGALVRYPADDPSKRIVLQKAWAVVEE